MAALQTNTIVNGQWQTTTLDMNDVLLHHQKLQEKAEVEPTVPQPVYGLLTRTVVESPVVNWIIPARVRHFDKNDVVFIGDNLVQLMELHIDGTFRGVARKSDFGSRIRSAAVIGELPPYTGTSESSPSRSLDSDIVMIDAPAMGAKENSAPANSLPPQYIVLALESGALVFLFVRDNGPGGTVHFVTKRHMVHASMLRVRPGANMTVDPSGRYLALSSLENLFAVFELRSRPELVQQYERSHKSFNPVKNERYMFTEGIIHKMEFLYPEEDEKERIILLQLVIRKRRTKMYVHVWNAGDHLATIRPLNAKGHRVHDEAQLPVLLIPLQLNSNFLVVSEDRVMLCKDLLIDTPDWLIGEVFASSQTSQQHHGIRPPIFTAWARPRRLKEWSCLHDVIYIAREDGLIYSIDVETDYIETIMDVGTVECNIGEAFACVDFADQEGRKDDHKAISTMMGDVLVIGGDFSNGAAYSIRAREPLRELEHIGNWSPTPDFVAIPANASSKEPYGRAANACRYEPYRRPSTKEPKHLNGTKAHENAFSWADRIFASSGKGRKGAIVELRHGLETRPTSIEYEGYIKRSWVLPDGNDESLFFVLSLIDQSALWQFPNDSQWLEDIEQVCTWLDLSSSTILTEKMGNCTIQVTEAGIRISTAPSPLKDKDSNDYLEADFPNPPEKTHAEAVIKNQILCVTTRIGLGHEIEMNCLKMDLQTRPFLTQIRPQLALESEPTFLFMNEFNGVLKCFYALASNPGYIYILSLSGDEAPLPIPLFASDQNGDEDLAELVCHSIAIIRDGSHQVLLCGFRDGGFRSFIIYKAEESNHTILPNFSQVAECAEEGLVIFARDSTQLGTTEVTVTVDPLEPETAFVRCDSAVYRFVFDQAGSGHELSMSSLHRLWYTDGDNSLSPGPSINSVTRFSHEGYQDHGNLLFTGHSTIIVASLDTRPKIVPRYLPLRATPSALLYSVDLGVLVVAVTMPPKLPQACSQGAPQRGKTNILFIDPDSGRDLSRPVKSSLDRSPVQFIGGLGKTQEISALGQWELHKHGLIFWTIVVATRTQTSGHLYIIQAERVEKNGELFIEYWLKGQRQYPEPVFSFASTEDSFFICTNEKLYWERLVEKKFQKVAESKLPSAGLSIDIRGKFINVLTARHSMMVLKFSPEDSTMHDFLRDQVARHGLQQLSVPDYPLRLISDRTTSVTGLWYRESACFTDAASTVFEAELATSIIKFQIGKLYRNRVRKTQAEWFESHENRELSSGHSEKILGIGIDGSVHLFEVLPQDVWVLLRFIQNMAMHSQRISPFTFDRQERDEYGNFQIEPLITSPVTTRHVNGDILERCKALGFAGFKAIISQPLPDDEPDWDNPDARKERFEALTKACLSRSTEGRDWDPYWEAYKLMCSHLSPVL